MSDYEDAQQEINAGSGGFYAPGKTLKVGESEEITLVSYCKWTDTKYPIKDKQGNSKGYTWRFRLEDGRVWDVSNKNRSLLLGGMHPNNSQEVFPCRFKITNTGVVSTKAPAIKVEVVGTPEPKF